MGHIIEYYLGNYMANLFSFVQNELEMIQDDRTDKNAQGADLVLIQRYKLSSLLVKMFFHTRRWSFLC